MQSSFLRSLRSVESESFRWGMVSAGAAATLLAAWLAWLIAARIPVYVVSSGARLEVWRTAEPAVSRVSGQVVSVSIQLGQMVSQGAVLVSLDSRMEQADLDEATARLYGTTRQLTAIGTEATTREEAIAREREKSNLALDEARARERGALAAAAQADAELDRAEKLRGSGAIAEAEYTRLANTAREERSNSEASALASRRIEAEQNQQLAAERADLASVRRQEAALRGQAEAESAEVVRARLSVGERTIRSPSTGRIGEIADIRVGSHVAEGDKIGSVVPAGGLKVTAEFPVASASGRIHPGQFGQLRLDAFPAVRYGTVPVRVVAIATEATEGHVRVELALAPAVAAGIRLEHGMTGVAEVEVERASPASLLLRTVGESLRPKGMPR